MADQYAARIS